MEENVTKRNIFASILKKNLLVVIVFLLMFTLTSCKDPETEVETYTVTLLGNEGTPEIRTIEVRYGEPLPSDVTPPVREGFEFLGYFDNPNIFDSTMFYTRSMISYYDWACECDGVLYALWSQ